MDVNVIPLGQGVDMAGDVKFWTRIMKEHALFIKEGLPCNRPDLVAEAERFYGMFEELEARVQRNCQDPAVLHDLRRAVADLINYQRQLTKLAVQCQLKGCLFPLLLDHITREAMHFLRVLMYGPEGHGPGMGDDMPPMEVMGDQDMRLWRFLHRMMFWLRLMKDHAQFIAHLLDPSENQLIRVAQDFVRDFAMLLATTWDFASMASSRPESFPAVARLIDNVTEKTTAFRDFTRAAYDLLKQCKVLSIIENPLLADHLTREADKFLEELRVARGWWRGGTCPPTIA